VHVAHQPAIHSGRIIVPSNEARTSLKLGRKA
jgi:hypothetical protein